MRKQLRVCVREIVVAVIIFSVNFAAFPNVMFKQQLASVGDRLKEIQQINGHLTKWRCQNIFYL